MNKKLGLFLGLVLSATTLGLGLYGTIATIEAISATAEPFALWFALGACVLVTALGLFMLTQWGTIDEKRQEARH